MVKDTMMQREKYELYLRNIASEVIDDTYDVKNIVNQVFEELNITAIHSSQFTEDELERYLVALTRSKIIQFLNDNIIYDSLEKVEDLNINTNALKYSICNEFFDKFNYLNPVDVEKTTVQIDNELEKLSNMEKEVLIRKYYFLQSEERISEALDINLLKVEYLARKVTNILWRKIIKNNEIFSIDVSSKNMDIRYLKKNLQKHLIDISKCWNIDRNYISTLNIQEYFIIKVLGDTTLSEVELIFEDICLEGMSKCKPSREEKDDLKYLTMYRNLSELEIKKRYKKRRGLLVNGASIAVIFGATLFTILTFSGGKSFSKASNIYNKYNVRCEKLGMNFTYEVKGKDIRVDVEQLYYVKDELIKDYSYKLDTELTERIERHNLYADSIDDEQTVCEAAQAKYLSSENEADLGYVRGDRKYVYNSKYNILFVIEYKASAWECIKVIYVKELGVNSKYYLDSKTILKDFYKESADGNWKCEVQKISSKDEKQDTFYEVTFVNDDSKITSTGIYRTGNLVYNRTFNTSKSTMEMNPVNDLSRDIVGDDFITYIEDDREVILYYNYYEEGKFNVYEIGKVDKDILEEIAGYIEEYPDKIKDNIDDYGICIPQIDKYILPYMTVKSKNSEFVSDYREFDYYDNLSLLDINEQLKILTYSKDDTANYDKTYKLNDEEYYKNIAVINTYRNELMTEQYVGFMYENDEYKYRVFNNEFVEILEYKGDKQNVNIPNYIDGLEVRYIANGAFIHQDSIIEVNIPESVREIGNAAFAYCESLQRVVINGNVISYGDGAYEGCKKLTEIISENSPMYVGKDCFKDTIMLSKMCIENGVKYYKNVAVSYEDNDNYVEVKEGTRAIADNFLGVKARMVQEVSIPISIKYIGRAAFEGAVNLRTLELPSGLVYIGEYAFSGCHSLDDVSIPMNVTEIKEGVFASCINLKKIKFGDGVKAIRDNAFSGIGDLDVVNVPSNVVCIFPKAFDSNVKVLQNKE